MILLTKGFVRLCSVSYLVHNKSNNFAKLMLMKVHIQKKKYFYTPNQGLINIITKIIGKIFVYSTEHILV